MKVKLGNILGISLVTMLLLSIFMLPIMAGDPLVPHAGNVMWIESDDPRDTDEDPQIIKFWTDTMSVGDRFNITVWLNMETDVFAWQFILDFCSAYMNVTDAGFTAMIPIPGLTSQYMEGHTVTKTGPIMDNIDDFVMAAETCLGDDFIPGPHHGSLLWIEFEITAAPAKGECLECGFYLSYTFPADTWVWNPDLQNVLESVEDCPYSYNWTPPTTRPHMAVHNPGPYPTECTTTWFFERGTEWNCTWFKVDIYISHLDPAWGLVNASFILTYDPTVIYTDPTGLNITIYDPPWNVSSVNVVDGTIEFFVESECGLDPAYIEDYPKDNSVLVATVEFHIFDQGFFPTVDTSALTFSQELFHNHEYDIAADPPQNGMVTIEGYLTMEMPWLEVIDPVDGDHEIVIGPEPSIGATFDVEVWIKNLDVRWRTIGFEFKLGYDEHTLPMKGYIECATPMNPCVEGDWLRSFANPPNTPANGTFMIAIDDHDPPEPPSHIKVGLLLLPRPNGTWCIFPEGEGVLVTVTFEVLFQSYPIDVEVPLTLYEILLVNDDGNEVPVDLDSCVNGTVRIITDLPGRYIDLYTQYDAPYGGQGPHMPSDMFWPQKIVYLYTDVTYNYWPVNNKDVGFEVEGPYDQETGEPKESWQIWLKASARTDKDGLAWIKFQLPWPCDNPEQYFGKWKVTATVDICCTVVNDTLWFDYQYLVMWDSVTVDRQGEPEYNHCETVEITVKFKSKAQQERPVLISVVLEDELQTPVGIAITGMTVGGAKPCHYVEYEVVLRIHVPQHAFAGIAHLLVNAFDKNPTEGGVPWTPQYTPLPEVWIQPY